VALFAYVRYTPTAYTGCGGESEDEQDREDRKERKDEGVAKGGKMRETAAQERKAEGKGTNVRVLVYIRALSR
jgi:hypothetical protein